MVWRAQLWQVNSPDVAQVQAARIAFDLYKTGQQLGFGAPFFGGDSSIHSIDIRRIEILQYERHENLGVVVDRHVNLGMRLDRQLPKGSIGTD